MPATFIKTPVLSMRVKQKPVKPSPIKPKPRDRQDLPISKPLPIQKHLPIQNRVHVLLVHILKLSIRGQARLAAEVGVSRSTISRLVSGRINPSYRLARGVTDALEKMLGKPLDMREVFSTDGTYLTPSGCALCLCRGCLPEKAWNEDGTLKPEWKGARPGDWSLTGLVHAAAETKKESEESKSGVLDYSDDQFHCDQPGYEKLNYGQPEYDDFGFSDEEGSEKRTRAAKREADFDARDAQFDVGETQFDTADAQWGGLR